MRRSVASRSSSSRRGAPRRRLLLIVLLVAAIGIPSGAEAAWDYFGEIRFGGGWAENPGLLDSSQPASLRGGQMEAASRLSLGARSEWEKTDFEFSYSPYGEIYEDSAPPMPAPFGSVGSFGL